MSNEEDELFVSDPIDLSRQVYVDGNDYQLLCCGPSGGGTFGGGGSTDNYLTAAEVLYELTGNPGQVVRDVITYQHEEGTTIEVDLLKGHFKIKRGDETLYTGRKALELLMRMKGLTFDQALEWIVEKYSVEAARMLAEDYVKRRLAALSDPS
ncbi:MULTISPECIES: hypothetical protein [unclassified Nonomuraea]|uniref:hypothetical protein n=1 Tax=Nonomuraea sp. NPDC047529 TaxID=3155623 RepID=UPI0033DA499D